MESLSKKSLFYSTGNCRHSFKSLEPLRISWTTEIEITEATSSDCKGYFFTTGKEKLQFASFSFIKFIQVKVFSLFGTYETLSLNDLSIPCER